MNLLMEEKYKKEINWKALTDEFIYDERGNRRDLLYSKKLLIEKY